MRLFVHAGFHKTGTTSVQKMLQRNQGKLSTSYRIFTRSQMKPLCEAARAWSIRRDSVEMGLYQYEAASFLESLDAADPRPVVLSSEDLSGHMPGRHGLLRYDAAPTLARVFAEVLAEVIPTARLTLAYSTRNAAPWVRSCYAQHIRATRLTDDLDSYTRTHLPHADLEADVASIRADLKGQAYVTSWPLEACQSLPFGPLSPLLDLIEALPPLRAKLTLLPPANVTAEAAILEQLLALNRSDLDRDALSAAKLALVRAVRDARGEA